MNERIEELVEQARRYANEYVEDEVEKQFHKKFVELIVKETITEMSQQLYWHGQDQSNNPSFYKAIDKTKKHFGIK